MYLESIACIWQGTASRSCRGHQRHLIPVPTAKAALSQDSPFAHGDLVSPRAGCLIRGQKFSEASSMLLKFAVSCEAQHMTSSQCKAYLGAVVVLLYAGNAVEAQATYQVSCQCRGAGPTPGVGLPCRLQTVFLSVQPLQVATFSVRPCL